MSLFEELLDKILGRKNNNSASVAKERLQIIISHERSQRGETEDFLPQLKNEIIAVIAKYVNIDKTLVKVQLERSGDNAILELNIPMPEKVTAEIK